MRKVEWLAGMLGLVLSLGLAETAEAKYVAGLSGTEIFVDYESGASYQLRFSDLHVTWTGIRGGDAGRTETDEYQSVRSGPGTYLVKWRELDGTRVTLGLDFNRMTVHSVVSSGANDSFHQGMIRRFATETACQGNFYRFAQQKKRGVLDWNFQGTWQLKAELHCEPKQGDYWLDARFEWISYCKEGADSLPRAHAVSLLREKSSGKVRAMVTRRLASEKNSETLETINCSGEIE